MIDLDHDLLKLCLLCKLVGIGLALQVSNMTCIDISYITCMHTYIRVNIEFGPTTNRIRLCSSLIRSV